MSLSRRAAVGVAGGGCAGAAQNGGICQSGYCRGHGLDGAPGRDHDHHTADRPAPIAHRHLGHLLGYRFRVDHLDPGAAGHQPVCARPLSRSGRFGAPRSFPGLQPELADPVGADGGAEFQRRDWPFRLRWFAGQPDPGDLEAAGGYLLGNLGKAGDWLQALGAGQRNIAAAMVVATMNFGNDEVVMVVVYSLIVMVMHHPAGAGIGETGERRIIWTGRARVNATLSSTG